MTAASAKAEDSGEAVNVDFLVKFLKDWYSSLNRTYGMGSLMEPKAASSSSSFPSSSGQKPTAGAQAGKMVAPSYSTNRTVGKPSSIPSSSQVSAPKANVAAIEANSSSQKFNKKLLQQQQQPSSLPSWGSSSSQWNRQTTQSGHLCIFCGGAHLVDICPLFSQLSVEER